MIITIKKCPLEDNNEKSLIFPKMKGYENY